MAVVLLGWLIVGQVRRQFQAGHQTVVRIQSLLLLPYVVVPMFAPGYFVIQLQTGDQFTGLHTRRTRSTSR